MSTLGLERLAEQQREEDRARQDIRMQCLDLAVSLLPEDRLSTDIMDVVQDAVLLFQYVTTGSVRDADAND